MKGSNTVIYWHRFGLKIYQVSPDNPPVLKKEIGSNDIEEIKLAVNYLRDQNILLLLSDSISYLYEKVIDPPLEINNLFRSRLLEIIKTDIPEDFSGFTWDYKVENNSEGKQKILVFAPVKEFQSVITEFSNSLNIKIDVIETESVASTRDPNPIIGITKKTDIKGKDQEVLNISLTPETTVNKNPVKIIILIILALIFFICLYIIFKPNSSPGKSPKIIPTITPAPTVPVTPPTPVVKSWPDLTVMVQNGTKISGLAAKTAQTFKNNGINQVNADNADSDTYTVNKLILKNILLKENYYSKINNIIPVPEDEVGIDNSQSYDVILILGTN